MNKLIIILLVLLWVTPAYAVIDNISSCTLGNIPLEYKPGVGIIIDNQSYDNGAAILEYYNSSFMELKPSYQTSSVLDKNVINPGDKFTVSFQLVGQGNVKSNLLSVSFPSNFLNTKDSGYVDMYVTGTENNHAIWFNEKPCEKGLESKGFTTAFDNAIFGEFSPNSTSILGEMAFNGHSPLVLTVKTDANVFPGDRLIKIIFLYSDGKEWYSTREDIPIHIRDWYEMRQNQYLGVFIALVGFVYKERKVINKSLQKLSNKIKSIIR